MKFLLLILISFLIFANDSTKVKPVFKYKKKTEKSLDTLEQKIKILKQKIDSVKFKKQKK